ncbi:TPA: helix-turn-helix domain-containing protein [Staphylococcus pseudintermedius]
MNNRIAELRKEKNMTLKQLAEVLNIRDNTLSQYETGKRNPQNGLLQEIANFFGVSIEYIIKATDKRDYPVEDSESAIELLEKMENEKNFNYLSISNNTALNLSLWIINNMNYIKEQHPKLLYTANFLVESTVSENKILQHYSEMRIKEFKIVDEIDDILLEREFYGASAEQTLEFLHQTERIGFEQTKKLMEYIKQLPTEECEDENV